MFCNHQNILNKGDCNLGPTDIFSLPGGSKCDVMGLGIVKVKMFDEVIHTLGGVMYVPMLRKNLISLSQLESKSCECSIAGGP